MTTYRSTTVREATLRALAEARGDSRSRRAYVVGVLTALLDDDREMVAAINAACQGPQEKAKELAPPGKAA